MSMIRIPTKGRLEVSGKVVADSELNPDDVDSSYDGASTGAAYDVIVDHSIKATDPDGRADLVRNS